MERPIAYRFTPWVAAIPIGAVLLNFALFPHYTGDDAFIHFTYVRNLLERGILAYNSPQASFGSSSILWVLLGALASWPTGAIPQTMRVLGATFFVLSVVLAVAAVHRQHPLSGRGQFLIAVFLAANAMIFRWMSTGMETGLVCLTAIVFLAYADRRRPILAAVLCLVAFLVRPEFLLLPLCFLTALRMGQPWDWRAVSRFVAACLVLFGCWFGLAQFIFGRSMPMTAVKSVGWIDIPSTVRIIQIVVGTFSGILAALAVFAVAVLQKGPQNGMQNRLQKRTPQTAEWAFLFFGIGLIVFYLFTGTNLISRYLTVVYLPLATLCALHMARKWMVEGRISWQAGGVILTVVLIEAGMFGVMHAPHLRSFVDGFQATYTGLGKRIERLGPADSGAVMVADVGIVGYYSRRPVIDLAGLTSSHVYDAGTREDSVLVERYHPRFVIVRDEGPRIPGYIEMLSRIAAHQDAVRIVQQTSIPPLGVMSDPAKWWQVVLYEVSYRTGEPVPFSGGRGSAADSSPKQAN
jgi:hypothetical protein